MKELIQTAIRDARSLPQLEEALILLLYKLRSQKSGRLSYIAGIIGSDGPSKVNENRAHLENYTNLMSFRYPEALFFSAPSVFTDGVYNALPEFRLPWEEREPLFISFWRNILKSGVVSDVSFTPRWKKSRGASDEHQTVVSLAIPHQFILQPRPEILVVRNCCKG